MNPQNEQSLKADNLPYAEIQKKKGFSIIWLIPLVAILIAAGLVYKAVTEKGPSITITFKSAEGLEAGKTKIKYKDVEIGEVETVVLSADLTHVIVTANLIKDSKPYLNESTRFWVVRARFSGGVASGLGTLFSGSYIAIDPGKEGPEKFNYKGLEIPPVVTSDLPGRHFILKAPELGSLQYSSPIYFKGINVGQVVGHNFSAEGTDLEIKIFIEEPYDKNVRETTRFWVATGLDMVLDSNGVRIDTQSFTSMLIGGIAFENPEHQRFSPAAKDNDVFNLYKTFQAAMEKQYAEKDYYLLKFDDSVRGLSIGAPVEYRGFPMGKVVDIWLEPDLENNEIRIPVRIEVEPDRIKQFWRNDFKDDQGDLVNMVKRGFRAQLKTGNLITGSLYVAFDFFESADPASIIVHDNIVELPTIPGTLTEMTEDLTALLEKISKIPIEEIGVETLNTIKSFKNAGDGINEIVSSEDIKNSIKSLDKSLKQIELLTSDLENKLPGAIDSISVQTVSTLATIEKLTAPDSEIVFELKKLLRELTQTSQAIRLLSDQLERHPESIITGKGKE